MPDPRWPELPYAAWKDTAATLHLWTQIVGKVRLAATPWLNHSWHVTLRVTARGLATPLIPSSLIRPRTLTTIPLCSSPLVPARSSILMVAVLSSKCTPLTMMLPFVMTPIETAFVLPPVAPVPPVPPLHRQLPLHGRHCHHFPRPWQCRNQGL